MRKSNFLLRAFMLIGALMTFQIGNAAVTDYSVKFVRIEANQVGNDVVVRWLTSSEYDLDFFTIQRSLNGGSTWQNLGSVQSSGMTPGSDTYDFTDMEPAAGTVKYRIKETGFNGVYTYSFEVSIDVTFFTNGNEYELQVYPNPAEDEVVLESDEFSEDVIVEVMDVSGKLMTVDLAQNDKQITVRPINKLFGLYFLMISDRDKTTVRKIKFE